MLHRRNDLVHPILSDLHEREAIGDLDGAEVVTRNARLIGDGADEIRRPDSRIDEYEVLLDERGRDHDLLYVVRKADGVSIVGSAYKTPELRSALRQILKEPTTP